MVKVYKPGKVVIVLQGRQAGKKAVVIKQLDDGTKERPYPHALIAGVERYPKKVTKRMGSKKLAKRNKVKPFIKAVNYSHLFPTRYAFELESLKGSVTADTFREPSQREDSKKQIKKLLEERYVSGKNKWFFTPLRMDHSLFEYIFDDAKIHPAVINYTFRVAIARIVRSTVSFSATNEFTGTHSFAML